MKITCCWMGTNAILIDTGAEKLLFDPFVELTGGENPNCMEDFLGSGADCILITHGHFDHLLFVPEMMEEGEQTVICSGTPSETLEKMTGQPDRIIRIAPGTTLSLGNVRVSALQGRHIVFDAKLILRTFFSTRMIRFFRNLLLIGRWAGFFPEGGETLVYELETQGKLIQILGSLGLDEGTQYRQGADLLFMPYQGRSRLETEAEKVIRALRPKRIMLTHFDDAFPPISSTVDTKGLKRMMRERFPGIQVIRPKAGKTVRIV